MSRDAVRTPEHMKCQTSIFTVMLPGLQLLFVLSINITIILSINSLINAITILLDEE